MWTEVKVRMNLDGINVTYRYPIDIRMFKFIPPKNVLENTGYVYNLKDDK